MPIKIGGREFEKFKQAEAFIRRSKPDVEDPAAYVASIEQNQKPKHTVYERKRGPHSSPKFTPKEYPPKYEVYKRKRGKQ